MVRPRGLTTLTVALSCSLTGCLAVYSTRPVEVIVTSAETGQPVANLPVAVDYPLFYAHYFGPRVLNMPKEAGSVTDENGRIVLPIADFGCGPIRLRAGDYGSSIKPDQVREGGMVAPDYWAFGPEKTPKVILQLVPQRRSFAQRLFDSLR